MANDDKRIPEWIRLLGFLASLMGSTGAGVAVTVKFVGDPLSERMIRIEEQNKYLSAQIAELKVSSGDFVFEDIRIENKIRKLVKPESLR